ncbi:tyrosine-type recombinase/integrase [Kitasatospora mediocidica]|uniref:tyrosine-type recombinase/integrase n=1 Tax=Kitasatospora mediocidica TaxID=58352 RepID=UPI0005609C6A|nr:site-specific integrase [Kitasatospora mediocidica]
MSERKTRQPNLESTIYEGSDGRWHGRVTMGVKADGSPDRRHRSGKTQTEVERKVKALEKARDAGRVTKAGRVPTVETWMTTYLDTIASQKLKPRSLDDYWSKTRNHIIPGIGKHRLDRLQPEHLDALYAQIRAEGRAASHILKVHRILSRALKIAHRRELIARNVATLLDPPSLEEVDANPFTQEEARRFLQAAMKRPTGLRWAIGVGQGLRQGEALGLRWKFIDEDAETLDTSWQLQRLRWRHGCADPHLCGERLHRTACKPGCTKHRSYKRGCPKPCPPACCGHASTCPERHGGGLAFTRPKTKGSRRTAALLPPLKPALVEHRQRQAELKAEAGEAWEDYDLVFCRPDGRPIDPRDDWEEFKELLAEAGIEDRRQHDGSRHSAGTILNELGVDPFTIMEILGHSQISMTRRYVKTTTPTTREAARRMGNALWPQTAETETTTETTDSRAARARRRRRMQ